MVSIDIPLTLAPTGNHKSSLRSLSGKGPKANDLAQDRLDALAYIASIRTECQGNAQPGDLDMVHLPDRARVRAWARSIKTDVHALYLAARDPRTPWYAKVLALGVAGYALSPIDLIPDFIPVLGYLDDVIIVPLGILAVVKLIPPDIMAEHRAAAALAQDRPVSRVAAVIIVCLWAVSMALAVWFGYRWFR